MESLFITTPIIRVNKNSLVVAAGGNYFTEYLFLRFVMGGAAFYKLLVQSSAKMRFHLITKAARRLLRERAFRSHTEKLIIIF